MTYQHLNSNVDLKQIKFRYNMAKWLTTASMLTVILLALYSIFYPGSQSNHKLHLTTDHDLTHSITNEDFAPKQNSNSAKRNSTCQFSTNNMMISNDSLLQALSYVSDQDFNNYCDSWDSEYGFSDDLHLNNQDCGNWQDAFSTLQQQRLQELEQLKTKIAENESLLNSDDVPAFVSYVCQEDPMHRGSRSCGGLADRMSGMISTFFYALMTNRGFFMNWQEGDPTSLESVFEKPTINWSFDPEDMKQLYKSDSLGFQSVNTLNFNWEKIRAAMFPDGPIQDFNELWTSKYVEVKSNRGYIIRTFEHSTRYTDTLNEMGLTKTNSFRCILDYLLRPKTGARRFINAYKQLFQMDSVLSIGLQIRTDDQAMAHPEDDTNNFETWNYFISCANDLRDAKRQPHHKRVVYFLLTDSNKLRQEFVAMNNNQTLRDRYIKDDQTSMVVTGLPIEHIEAKTVKTKFDANITDSDSDHERLLAGVNSAVIDNWLLSYTDYRLISRQGFGKMAAFHANDPRSTISLPRVDSKEHVVDCGNPNSFTTFDTLSTWWSLG
ncbi:hypothetical protein BCR42DRAFT_416951 [Absidia repens]|uniref:Uncharacterized protein n=1 Tax=Absidia repens TaxID=90262 RepID=A0A1X2IFJ0_9FUNG|nr:hypothetical protein BCR42DRAFT_416951 [Absidia repens]